MKRRTDGKKANVNKKTVKRHRVLNVERKAKQIERCESSWQPVKANLKRGKRKNTG